MSLRILVTGGCGFIGSNLIRVLRQRHPDSEIVVVDSMWTGVRRRDEHFDQLVQYRIEHMPYLGHKFDYIYHLASPASPIKYQSAPLNTIAANVQGLMTCLQQHLKIGGTLFFASSSEVYGDPIVSPQPESYKGQVSCTGPRACYDEAKRLCETICVEWGRQSHLGKTKIARLFNVYGPGTLPDDGRCMSNFVWSAMSGKPLEIYGLGKQTRCFTFVNDVVDAIVRLTEEVDYPMPVNIGTNVETTVKDIAAAVLKEYLEWASIGIPKPDRTRVVYKPAVVDDPQQRLPDLTLAEHLLGWRVSRLVKYHGSNGGIRRLIQHFHDEYDPIGLEKSHKNSGIDDADAPVHNDTEQAVPPENTDEPAAVDPGQDRALDSAART